MNLRSLFPGQRVVIGILGLCGLTGCTSFTPAGQTQKRIRERPSVFQSLPPIRQSDVLGGAIQRGNTMDVVYLALGKPKKVVVSADGEKTMWVYEEHYVVKGPVTLLPNSRDRAYRTQIVSPNAPYHGGSSGPQPAGMAAPGYKGGNHDSTPIDFSATETYFHQVLEAIEIRTNTVYVFFFRGRVAEIKLNGDASGQTTAAANIQPN